VADLHRHSADRWRFASPSFRRMPPGVRQDRFVALIRANDADIAAILSPEQVARLKQISLQRQGLSAFHEPDVIAALKLTPNQRERLGAIEFDAFPRPQGSRQRSPEQAFSAAMKKVYSVLTEEQGALWKKMIGEPFVGPRPPGGGPSQRAG
jgi:hypothetical protein